MIYKYSDRNIQVLKEETIGNFDGIRIHITGRISGHAARIKAIIGNRSASVPFFTNIKSFDELRNSKGVNCDKGMDSIVDIMTAFTIIYNDEINKFISSLGLMSHAKDTNLLYSCFEEFFKKCKTYNTTKLRNIADRYLETGRRDF